MGMYTKKTVYIAGPYSLGGKASQEQSETYLKSMDMWGLYLWYLGYGPVHPIRNTVYVEQQIAYKDMLRADLRLVFQLDMIFMCPDWELSRGARIENRYARLIGKPILYWNKKIPAP